MSGTGIQGQPLEVTVVACYKLKDTEWISRQDPYVCVEYGSTKFRTRTCTDGGKNPTFQEKFIFPLIEGLRELNVVVWNSNTLTFDDFIGSGKVQLHKVLSQGFDDSAWPLQTKTGRHAGEVKLILHYANPKKSESSHVPSAPPYVPPATTHVPLYSASSPAPAISYPPPTSASSYLPTGSAPSYPPVASTVSYPPTTAAYPSPYSSAYPPSSYPASFAYPPSPYPASSPYPSYSSAYPPSSYPPPTSYPPAAAHPPPPYPPPAGYPPGIYPPPPY